MNTIFSHLGTLQARIVATHDERAATSTEYALLLTLVAIAIIASLSVFGNQLTALFANAASSVSP
ncbi:hypothetical protein Back2_14950 [Nocardioides baekrokdamisoli]|uniref:Flp family type IVb pilin n=1 Tax=Nocardioides baekrokdamisoli TaxID=1804624 RepID=A0A3G9J0P7_9ACTN|nr:Flp family type IVb pilin [Nocardioides baekrokdamisoli]BBH17208.1 hypothetical protein Back2_14950 [Nocardioides baekrokdamisoli]